jgi:hypothetical protein
VIQKAAKSTILMLFIGGSIVLFAKSEPEYQVGTFVETSSIDDGSLVSWNHGFSKGIQQRHNGYTVSTDFGDYFIEAPTSVAGSIIMGLATNAQSANIHKDSFLDTLHVGDKVLFTAKCNKHNRCEIKMPNSDRPEKTINTVGWFSPARGKSNVTALCGHGKLSALLEEQYCVASAFNPIKVKEPEATKNNVAVQQSGIDTAIPPKTPLPSITADAVHVATHKRSTSAAADQKSNEPTSEKTTLSTPKRAIALTSAQKGCNSYWEDKSGNGICMGTQY